MTYFDKKEFLIGMKKIFRSKYFYISLIIFLMGVMANYLSQMYLYSFESKGNPLPILSDLILDHIPYYNISGLYDWFIIIAFIIFILYVVDKNNYDEVPYYLLLFGIFLILRGVFIILTPFGNPENFIATKSIFRGFAKYELGLYPSGHTGGAFMYLFLTKGKYKILIGFCSFIIIASLLLSRSHYSIDILSGILFAYAIHSFGRRYLNKFKIKD